MKPKRTTVDPPDEIFGEDDTRLFACDDKDLKAKAIRNSIIPRLLEIIRECVSEVRHTYGVDALDVSTLCWSPHSAESRGKRGYDCDFLSASAGLAVKRTKGRPMRLLALRLAFASKGIMPFLDFARGNLESDILKETTDFVARHETEILSLIVMASARLYVNKEKQSARYVDWYPLAESFSALMRFQKFEMGIGGFPVAPPIGREKKERAITMFTVLFPLYWALAEIGEGRTPASFAEMVRKAFEYKKRKSLEWGKSQTDQDDFLRVNSDAAERLAETRTKVPVGRRWQVFERDNWHCVSCGRGAEDGAILEVDHILPRSKGGRDTLDNYQTLCRECNMGKSNKSQKDLRKK